MLFARLVEFLNVQIMKIEICFDVEIVKLLASTKTIFVRVGSDLLTKEIFLSTGFCTVSFSAKATEEKKV